MHFRAGLLCSAFAFAAFMATAAGAADVTATAGAVAGANASTSVSTVVVTARKRAENEQTVPVAITAQTGQQLQQAGIREPSDLGRIAPSLVAFGGPSTPTGVSFQLRGQSAVDILLTIPQAVGFYVDSVNIPHPEGSDISFFDLSRVEVLNGPQGTLYGRNTTGGAINVITRGADYNGYHGYGEGEVGNFSDWKAGGAVNIPIIEDKLAIRLAYQHWNRNGFGKSLITSERFGDPKNDDVARLSIKFDPTPRFSVTAKVEYDHARRTDNMYQLLAFSPPGMFEGNLPTNLFQPGAILPGTCPLLGPPGVPTASGQFCPGFNAPPGANFSLLGASPPFALGVGTVGGLQNEATELLAEGFFPGLTAVPGIFVPPGALATAESTLRQMVANMDANPFVNYQNLITGERLSAWHGVFDASWRITDDVTLRSITGVHQFTDFRTFNLFGLPGDLIVGPGSGNGAIPLATLQPFGPNPNDSRPLIPDEQSLSVTQELDLSGSAFDNHLTWLVGGFYSHDSGQENQTATIGFPLATFVPSFLGLNEGPIDVNFFSPSIKNQSEAVFTQDDLKFNDVFSLTVGGRFTHEHLSQLTQDALLANIGASPLGPPPPVAPGQYFICLAGPKAGTAIPPTEVQPQLSQAGCSIAQSVSSSGWSYLFSFNAQVTHDVLFYVKTSRGFKGASLQQRAATFAPALPETATEYEAGLKSEWFDHRLRANLDGYYTLYSNKQQTEIITINGNQTTPIINVPKTHISGFEWQIAATPLSGVDLFFTGDYLHGVYADFPNAITTIGSTINASGLTFTAPWTLDIGGRLSHPIGPGVLAFQADYSWSAPIPQNALTVAPGEPQFVIDRFFAPVGLVNARLDYTIPDQGLTLSLFATNLLDKHWVSIGIPFLGPATDLGWGATVQEPRMFGFQIRKSFGPGE